MKKWEKKILALMAVTVMLAGCVGCATNGADKGTEGQPQEDVSQEDASQENASRDDGESDMQGDSIEAENEDPFGRGEFPEPLPLPEEDLFDYEAWETEKTKISAPGGVVFDGEDLLVCDTGNHCVVRLTTDGDFVESYGELGSESGNFVTPTAILLHENEIYVLDSGNMRIQVFDTDMNYNREIWFEGSTLPSGGKYNDMAIAGDGTIYITTNAAYGDGMSLFYIEEEELHAVPGGGLGFLSEQDGIVYTSDKWRFYRDSMGYGWQPGVNWIYQVDRTGLRKVCELPYKYAPADFVVREDTIYIVSTVWGNMHQFSMEAELLETMFYIEEVQTNDMYLCVQDENTFYVADTEGFLYKVFRTEGEE